MKERNLRREEFRVSVLYDVDTNLPAQEDWLHYENGAEGRPCGMPQVTSWDEQGRIIERRYAHHGIPGTGKDGIEGEYLDPETGKRLNAWDKDYNLVEEAPSIPDFRVADWEP